MGKQQRTIRLGDRAAAHLDGVGGRHGQANAYIESMLEEVDREWHGAFLAVRDLPRGGLQQAVECVMPHLPINPSADHAAIIEHATAGKVTCDEATARCVVILAREVARGNEAVTVAVGFE